MENMLPLNFGVRTKGRIKANTLLNPAFWETFSVKYSLRKEIVHHHMGLHCIGVHILLHAVGGDYCYENGLSGSGLTRWIVTKTHDEMSQKLQMKYIKNYKWITTNT